MSRSLIQLIKSTPAVGWVRANELADREATMELLQLRRRVEELQTELSRARISAPKGSEGLAQGDEEHATDFSFATTAPGEFESQTWTSSFSPTWQEMFACMAP